MINEILEVLLEILFFKNFLHLFFKPLKTSAFSMNWNGAFHLLRIAFKSQILSFFLPIPCRTRFKQTNFDLRESSKIFLKSIYFSSWKATFSILSWWTNLISNIKPLTFLSDLGKNRDFSIFFLDKLFWSICYFGVKEWNRLLNCIPFLPLIFSLIIEWIPIDLLLWQWCTTSSLQLTSSNKWVKTN